MITDFKEKTGLEFAKFAAEEIMGCKFKDDWGPMIFDPPKGESRRFWTSWSPHTDWHHTKRVLRMIRSDSMDFAHIGKIFACGQPEDLLRYICVEWHENNSQK